MNVGDIVVPTDGQNLRSGASVYDAAIVVQTDPLVLVSWSADMRWESTVADRPFKVEGRCPKDRLETCMRRL